MSKLYLLQKRWARILTVVIVGMLVSVSAYAYTDYNPSWQQFTYDKETGMIKCRISYYHSWGGGWDGHCGWNDGVTISLCGVTVELSCGTDGKFSWGNKTPDYVKELATDDNHSDGEDTYRKVFYIPVRQDDINNNKVTVSVSGNWWKRDPADDEMRYDTYTVDLNVSAPKFDMGEPEWVEENGMPMVKIPWTRSETGTVRDLGTIKLTDENGASLKKKGKDIVELTDEQNEGQTSGAFYLDPTVEGSNVLLSAYHDYGILQEYTPTGKGGKTVDAKYTVTENSKKRVKAYAQPDNFKVQFLDSEKKLRLTWNIPGAPMDGYSHMGNFVVEYEIKDKNNEDKSKKGTEYIEYVGGQTSYGCDILLDEGVDAVCTFKVYRSAVKVPIWQTHFAQTIKDVEINTHHASASNLQAELSKDNSKVTLTWETSGEVWSQGTSFIITRLNRTTGASEDIVLTEKVYRDRTYVDDMIKLCNEYQYKLQIQPNESYGDIASLFTDPKKNILPMEKGDLLEFTASKGYFSDRVELSWTKSGLFDEFAIERKEHGQDPAFYKKILTEPSSGASDDYKVKDETAEPGKIYDYRIVGLAQCADTVLRSDEMLCDIGFRTPTGDIYGRVTYENGQAEDSVEVYLESDLKAIGQSLYFDGINTSKAEVDGGFMNAMADSVTLQAWIRLDKANSGNDKRSIISKAGMYEIGLTEENKVYFKVGDGGMDQVVSAKVVTDFTGFFHVTAVKENTRLLLYIDGELVAEKPYAAGTVTTGKDSKLVIGGNLFTGWVDEVRVWNRPLGANEIKNNYNRYIVGNETSLMAYYTFNYAIDSAFYDMSYDKMSVYNENHGTMRNVLLDSKMIPTNAQLGYRAYTGADGTYKINGIPYVGNGTSYNIIPKKGVHQFDPQQEIRLISSGTQSFTVNFTDKSSFELPITVVYQGGTYPVKDVQFKIDGVVAMDGKGQTLVTDADGRVTLQVPVGTHEVKAVKDGHTFAIDGRICNSDSTDINYQTNMSRRTIEDITMVKYVGRVAGGTIQDEYPVGFGLSKNNLADGVKVTLTPTVVKYKMDTLNTSKEYWHELKNRDAEVESNKVLYGEDAVTIEVNEKTGEFVAWVRPEEYKVTVIAQGHPNIPGNNSMLNLKAAFATQYETYEHPDTLVTVNKDTIFTYDPIDTDLVIDTTVLTKTDSAFVMVTDTVFYNFKQKFIKRVKPEVSIEQLSMGGEALPYFGEAVVEQTDLVGNKDSIVIVGQDNKYLFGKPLFRQGNRYMLDVNVFEGYRYNGAEDGDVDRVPTQDAKITFGNKIAGRDSTIVADSLGHVVYAFFAGNPVMDAKGLQLTATVTIGSDEGSKSTFPWTPSDNFTDGFGFVIGGKPTGTNFVTGGPDRLLTVLRDPPGSNSYAYLEKGVSFESTSTYSGTVHNEGEESTTIGAANAVYSWHGVGSGVMNVAIDAENGTKIGVVHEETYTGTNTKSSSTTMTSRFSTSASPEYVGADGDVYVGYATNLTFGQTNNVIVESKADYEKAEGKGYGQVLVDAGEWILVLKDGTSITQSFNTLFSYPQRHIEDVLIPQLETMRDSYLMPMETADMDELQRVANELDTVFYVSYLPLSDPDYGKSNSDTTIKASNGNPDDPLDGPSYKVIYKNDKIIDPNSIVPLPDTISFINQSIVAWEQAMADNEKAKLNSELVQNYSFHAGSEVEYSESYSAARQHVSSFEILIGMTTETSMDLKSIGIKTGLDINETVSTTQGGEFESETERSHSKGFVLAEEGTDYITVDVRREKNENNDYDNDDLIGGDVENDNFEELGYYSSFIFMTKGGVTSCPYEGERVTKYYEPGTVLDVATMSMERPMISAKTNFLENVPSGEPARFTVYIKNESEADETMWFNLKILDKSNPDGAKIYMDGSPIGTGRKIMASREEITKTIEIEKGAVLNYDNLQLVLESECQPSDETDVFEDIADTLTLSVHYTKSCTDVLIERPATNWTYNTKLDTVPQQGHYIPVVLGGFDVNYADFDHIELQYKPASGSENDYITLVSFYNDEELYQKALDNGMTAEMIKASDGGKINYNWFMDSQPDQRYDLRAVSVCNIDNELTYNYSPVSSGIKDMYEPRLFGSPQPADGILSAGDDIRVNFNEPIADGYLTYNNFQITGVLNGSETDHSVSVQFDGMDDYMASDAVRNLTAKDFTVEMWINGNAQDAVLFSHGNVNDNINFGITADNHLFVRKNAKEIRSTKAFNFDKGSWAHVAMILTADGKLSLYYNYDEILAEEFVGAYQGIGNFVVGKGNDSNGLYSGRLHNLRVWDKVRTRGELQLNSNVKMSGNDVGLMLYCPMDEGRGTVVTDKARAAHLAMYGCEWARPEGRSTMFDGQSGYLTMDMSAAVIQSDMDYTLEFWFKAAEGSKNATMLSNGRGDGTDLGGSLNTFTIGFDGSGSLYFANNANKVIIDGSYADNNWHHIVVTVGRVQGRLQIYMDGKLNTYFGADKVGGIEGASLYVGARGWYNPGDAQNLHIDEYFQGSIDEVRLWNLYKTSALVEEFMYKRLDGNEMGLLAYYPFEDYKNWQGSVELSYTLQCQVADRTQGVSAVVTGTAVENADIAPIVDRGSVTELEFDYVVNNDALIITLKEPSEEIEKTIITFTLEEVMDMNGNTLKDKISWTAYIDRNQLKWSQNEWTDSKQLYDEYGFTVNIVNNGGSIMNYTIENMPSWLSAEPSEGKMDPSSTEHVTFTVREDLNVGTYNEVIYLKNEDNVSEPLELNLTVVGDMPEWFVDPSAYKYSMSVFGKMRFNNIFSDDKNDMIAAFSGNECVGVANSVYNKDVDMWYAMLTVYGNVVNGTALTFRMWDASTGITYEATPSEEITFRNNAIYGTPANPVIFDGQTVIYQDIALSAGWNWISFNLVNAKMSDLNNALSSGKWHSGDQIKTMVLENGDITAHFADYSTSSKQWKNANFGLTNTNMYMLYTANAQTLSLDGVLADPTEYPLTLKAGMWNYIGFLPNKNLPVKTALAGYEAKEGDVVKSMDKFAMYSGNNWIGSLEYLEPTAGYMLLNNDKTDKTLVYPTVSTTASRIPQALPSSNYSFNMSVIAIGDFIEEGDELYAVVDGEERGEAIAVGITRNETLQFVSVSGEAVDELVIFRLVKVDGSEYTSANRLQYKANSVVGTLDNPYVLTFELAGDEAVNVVSVSPNPAEHMVDVSVRLSETTEVSVRIFDMSDRQVYSTEAETSESGIYHKDINVSTFPSGSYLIEVHVGDEVYVEKLIKK